MSLRGCWYRALFTVGLGAFFRQNPLFVLTVLLIVVVVPYTELPEVKWHISVFFGCAFGLGLTLPALLYSYSLWSLLVRFALFGVYATAAIAGFVILAHFMVSDVSDDDEIYDEELYEEENDYELH